MAIRKKTQVALLAASLAFAGAPDTSLAASRIEDPSYWIEQLPAPDALVLIPREIKELNRSILERTDQMAELSSFTEAVDGEQLLKWLIHDPLPEAGTDGEKRYGLDKRLLEGDFFASIAANMNMEGVKETNAVRFGVIIERADIRAFPTFEPAFKSPGALEFDAFQYSSIYPGEAVALLHESSDGQWGFFQTRAVRGWIRLDKAAFGSKDTVTRYQYTAAAAEQSQSLSNDGFLVVTGLGTDIYDDKGAVLSYVPMGTVLFLKDGGNVASADRWVIRFPSKGPAGAIWSDAYVNKDSEVNLGFLLYTGKNVITEAFKMLGAEYGWGGKDGRSDCSEFIRDIFATMGIALPRNSRQQESAGLVFEHDGGYYTGKELKTALEEAPPGATLLGLDGHIMLYIGIKNDMPYVIHQVFGYRKSGRIKVVNKVSVTGLYAGSGTKGGAFKDRVRSVTEILLPVQSHAAHKETGKS